MFVVVKAAVVMYSTSLLNADTLVGILAVVMYPTSLLNPDKSSGIAAMSA